MEKIAHLFNIIAYTSINSLAIARTKKLNFQKLGKRIELREWKVSFTVGCTPFLHIQNRIVKILKKYVGSPQKIELTYIIVHL